MSTIAIYVFFFMLIASVLGYATAWAWSHPKMKQLKSDLDNSQKNMGQLKAEYDSLQSHANQLEKEKEKLVNENERLTLKLSMLMGKATEAKQERLLIKNEDGGFVDTSNLDQKINDLNAQIAKLNEEIDIVKRESLEWQVQYSEILQEKEALATQLTMNNRQ
ncbi:MAG TPA: hypothetical protein ENJ53_11215 [Phaeodactylibacter sp.]|nr:hypothetical protein [Phaeodactylibacter sp.]